MKGLLTLLFWTIFLSSLESCRSTGTDENGNFDSVQCSPNIVSLDDGTIDVDRSRCLCRDYRFSIDYVGSLAGSAKEYPLKSCNKIVGFKKYTDVATYWESVRRQIQSGQ